jgi:aspartate kinase
LLSNISYEEAIEMAYYGASVIHPKTLQPLKQKNIPFYVNLS